MYNALEAGATDFLVKPVDIHECQVRCRNLLTMQRQKHNAPLPLRINR